jgi:hypothetical protein
VRNKEDAIRTMKQLPSQTDIEAALERIKNTTGEGASTLLHRALFCGADEWSTTRDMIIQHASERG